MNDYLKLNIIILVSIIVVIISYVNEINYSKNNKIADIFILVIRFMHYFVSIILVFYAFIFDKKYDYYYILYIIFLISKWLWIKDCILAYIEKKYYHYDSNFDDIKYKDYYNYYLYFEYETKVFIVLLFFTLISLSIVLNRLEIPYYLKIYIILNFFYIIYILKKNIKGFFLNKLFI